MVYIEIILKFKSICIMIIALLGDAKFGNYMCNSHTHSETIGRTDSERPVTVS